MKPEIDDADLPPCGPLPWEEPLAGVFATDVRGTTWFTVRNVFAPDEWIQSDKAVTDLREWA